MSAATLTNFLGLISPDAETIETRSRRATFWVWTGTLFRRSLVTLKRTTPPSTTTAAAPTRIRVRFDTAIRRLLARPQAGCAAAARKHPKYKIRTPPHKVSGEPSRHGPVCPR